MEREQLRTILTQELTKGQSPEALIKNAQSHQIPRKSVIAEFEILAQQTNLPFFQTLQNFLDQEKNHVALDSDRKLYWDPVYRSINAKQFEINNNRLVEKLDKYLKNPKLPFRNLLLFSLPGILVLLGSTVVILTGVWPGALEKLIPILIFSFVPMFIYWAYIHRLQKDLIKHLIAEEKKWLYNPDEDTRHWHAFREQFSHFFNLGNESQNMQDEFWGKFHGPQGDEDFYSGIFEYTVVTRDSKGRKQRTKYQRTIFAMRLHKPLKSDFRLVPESIGTKILNFFTRKEIDTESIEFNKTFAFYYNGKKDEQALKIVKTLSPALQLKLLDLKNQYKHFSVWFCRDVALFSFSGVLLPKMKTNFFRKVELDPRDKKTVEDKINLILKITTEMVPYLD